MDSGIQTWVGLMVEKKQTAGKCDWAGSSEMGVWVWMQMWMYMVYEAFLSTGVVVGKRDGRERAR